MQPPAEDPGFGGDTIASSETGSDDGETGRAVPIRIDQFGYLPDDPKVAVIAEPEEGFDSDLRFEPGPSIEVRRWSDHQVVFTGSPSSWENGAIHAQSGDRGWWFDFSTVTEPGSYYLADPGTGVETGRFEIGADVYEQVLDAALRMFWFNRANTPHPESIGGPWSDDAAFIGPGQDTEARWVDDRSNPATALDLSGGWFDAGDTNKYVTFAIEPVHLLLTSYARYGEVFDDAVGIPESSNGIADVLDEVMWEIRWLERMQQPDGGVLSKVGLVDGEAAGIPSGITLPRFYEEACSSSTIAAAGMFAHAAVVAESVPALEADAPQLRNRAEIAWSWYQANEKRDDCDPQIVRAGDADMSLEEQENAAVVAAVYLWALTGDRAYESVVRSGYARTVPFTDDGFGRYAPDQADALLFYRESPGADPAIVRAIDDRIAQLVGSSATHGFDPAADLYRSYMPDTQYHWGSNMVKANTGSANLTIGEITGGRERALGHLHYFHGVNPLSMVYLTNMTEYGAERSAGSLFHFWFGERTAFDVGAGSDIGVAPGYLVGGPNAFYSGSHVPPAGQPALKSYRDWSSYGSEPSWEVTEPAIYYQAAYVRLLAAVLADT